MKKQIIFFSVFLLSTLHAIQYTDVSANSALNTSEMPDSSANKVQIDQNSTNKFIRHGFDDNVSIGNDATANGGFTYNSALGYSISAPERCFDSNSTSDALITQDVKAMENVTDREELRIALALPVATTHEQQITNTQIINNAKCMKITIGANVNYACGSCYSYFVPKMGTQAVDDNNKTYYMPNNTTLKGMFQYDYKNNKSVALIETLKKNNRITSSISTMDPTSFDPTAIPAALQNSREANISKTARSLQQSLTIAQIKAKVAKCYVRRELVPQFYCPIPGMEFGAKTGGNINDDLKKAKEQCNSYCESPSYGCRAADTGFSTKDTFQKVVTFNSSNKTPVEVVIPYNTKLDAKKLEYSVTKTYKTSLKNALNQELNTSDAVIDFKIEIMFKKIEGTDYIQLNGPTSYRLDSNTSVFSIPNLKGIESVKLKFYPPTLRHVGDFESVDIDDVLSELRVDEFEIEYTDNKYYFCSLDQVIIDPSTQCVNGKAYQMNGADGSSFIVCKADNKIQGPEKMFGAFYSQENCQAACKIKKDCLETYVNYANDPTSTAAYRIEVGCVDDPFNTSCSQQACLAHFRANDMPIEEYVFDNVDKARKTVTSGIQINGVSRPKVDIDNEMIAKASASQIDYDQVFLQEMKDQSYTNMISHRTYNYTEAKVGEATSFEYAYRKETDGTPNTAYYTGSLSDGMFYWKLKPSNVDYNGNSYHLYKIVKSEQMFKPISGAFMESNSSVGQVTYNPQRAYKDIVYSFVDDTRNYPFYDEEYAEVYIDSTDANTSVGWVKNAQHYEESYVAYDGNTGTYVASSADVPAVEYKTIVFDPTKNYEEVFFINNPIDFIQNLQDGGVIQTQTTTNQASLPLKHYVVSEKEQGKNAAVINYSLYGIYSASALTQGEIMSRLKGSDSEKYLIYRATKRDNNKKEIFGDGANRHSPVKMFIKGPAGSSTLTVDVKPRIEEESKDAVFFMYLYEGDIK